MTAIIVSSRAPVWGASITSYACVMRTRVSSRAPVWGASTILPGDVQMILFQVVPPCGGHPGTRCSRWLAPAFQVVPPCGGHLVGERRHTRDVQFQVVPPCGGHRRRSHTLEGAALFQVVPPCGGHHLVFLWSAARNCVSSRAPVWGASRANVGRPPFGRVSSRAPVWGASGCTRERGRGDGSFKSCPRVGGIS